MSFQAGGLSGGLGYIFYSLPGIAGATGPQGLQGIQGEPGSANISGTGGCLVYFSGSGPGQTQGIGTSHISTDGTNLLLTGGLNISSLAVSNVVFTDGSNNLSTGISCPSAYLSGLTSNVQTQLSSLVSISGTAGHVPVITATGSGLEDWAGYNGTIRLDTDGANTLQIGNANASTVSVGNSSCAVTINGNFTINGVGTNEVYGSVTSSAGIIAMKGNNSTGAGTIDLFGATSTGAIGTINIYANGGNANASSANVINISALPNANTALPSGTVNIWGGESSTSSQNIVNLSGDNGTDTGGTVNIWGGTNGASSNNNVLQLSGGNGVAGRITIGNTGNTDTVSINGNFTTGNITLANNATILGGASNLYIDVSGGSGTLNLGATNAEFIQMGAPSGDTGIFLNAGITNGLNLTSVSTNATIGAITMTAEAVPSGATNYGVTINLLPSGSRIVARLITSTGLWGSSSDRNLKENITDCDLGLDFINGLKPRSYKMRASQGVHAKERHHGFVAQEMRDFISVGGEEGSMTMCYTELIAPMVAGIQQLSDQVSKLRHKYEELDNDNSNLANEIVELKAQVMPGTPPESVHSPVVVPSGGGRSESPSSDWSEISDKP